MVVKSKKVKDKKDKDKDEKKRLKKKLKELSKKYLKGRKTRTKDPKKYKQIKEDINRKVDTAQSATDINKLMSLLQKPVARTPTEVGTIGQRLSNFGKKIDKVEKDIKSSTVKENYNNLKEQLSNVKDKYNNETISWNDIDNIYSSGKRFGQSIQTDIQTLMGMKTMYDSTKEGAKKAYDYLTRLLNRNRPSGTNSFNPSGEQPPQQAQPPTPPPTPPPSQPPPQETIQTPPPTVLEREDTETYLQQGLRTITNPIVGAGLLGLGAGYLNRRIQQTTQQQERIGEARDLISTGRREREARESFRNSIKERNLRRDLGQQNKAEEEIALAEGNPIFQRFKTDTPLERRLTRLQKSDSENELADKEEQEQMELVSRFPNLAQYQADRELKEMYPEYQDEEPQMEAQME